MATHVKVLGVLFLVFSGIYLLLAFGLSALMGGLAAVVGSSGDPDAAVGAGVLGLTGMGLMILFLCLAIPGLAAGIGLLKFKRWARILAIVLCILNLIQFPFGTIFGAYGLWVLFNKESEPLFT